MIRPKVLICCPLGTGTIEGIKAQLGRPDYDCDIFANRVLGSRPEVVAACIRDAREQALDGGFTHVLFVEPYRRLPAQTVSRLLKRNKPVVCAACSPSGSGFIRLTNFDAARLQGLGAVYLIRVDILSFFSFPYLGEWLNPNSMWLKRLCQLDVEVWIDYDAKILRLNSPEKLKAKTRKLKEANKSMSKVLERITMYYTGDPANPAPSAAFLSYDVADGTLRKRHQVYEVPEPDFGTDSPNTIWTAAVAQIKTNEGIS